MGECVACLQECRRTARGGGVACVVNPAAGMEKELGIGTLPPVERKKRVVVVGGGPAGMEAARGAAIRGHQVTLFEAQPALGGQVTIAAKAPTREELGGVTRYLSGQLTALGVEVRLCGEATAQAVLDERPDAVVVATGSVPPSTELAGAGQVKVANVWEVLQGKVETGQRVVVVDGGEGFWQSCSTAEFLARQGKHVELITPLLHVGLQLPTESLPMFYSRLLTRDVVFSPMTRFKELRGKAVVCENNFSRQEHIIADVDTVVLATTNRPSGGLAKALEGRVPELYAIGDCVSPRRIQHAIREGHMAGRAM